MAIGIWGVTTLSIGATTSGISNRYASICHATLTSSGSRVRRDGTMPISSSAYARRPLLPRPISTSAMYVLSHASAVTAGGSRPGKYSADLVVGGLDRHLDVVRV